MRLRFVWVVIACAVVALAPSCGSPKPRKCSGCGGAGSRPCGSCNDGTSQVACARCGGAGIRCCEACENPRPGQACTQCASVSVPEACRDCAGTGKSGPAACYACSGTGKKSRCRCCCGYWAQAGEPPVHPHTHAPNAPKCGACGGKGKLSCVTCRGAGRTGCGTCRGSGKQPKSRLFGDHDD